MATIRRLAGGREQLYQEIFTGKGVDIGCGRLGIDRFKDKFPGIQSIRNWDLPDGDGMLMATVTDNTFDFVHSSHSLEHMVDVKIALKNWIRILKKGGHLVVTIPDWEMYEHRQWPSRYNSDHKHAFTLDFNRRNDGPQVIEVKTLLVPFCMEHGCKILVCEICPAGYNPMDPSDQTRKGIECSIEFILQKL